MRQLPSFTRLAMALAFATTSTVAPSARAQVPVTTLGDAAEETTPQVEHPQVTVPAFAPLFTSADDARAFWTMWRSAYSAPIPDPRLLAKAFIKERLRVDGDDYVVAHFASVKARKEGKPDQAIRLTDALMEAFPDHSRHTAFAGLSDAVGGLNAGGAASPSFYAFLNRIVHGRSATDYFSQAGAFLWSRTGPGYLYNTFVAKGNVVDTVYEDLRRLDDAFGVFRAGTSFAREQDFRLSRILDEFKAKTAFDEFPYVKKLNDDFDTYWKRIGHDWTVLARYRFIEQARYARASGVLTQEQYEQVMAGGAPNVPLDGPIELWQLRTGQPRSVQVRHFDIHGYTSSNLLRFVSPGKGEVLYIPEGRPAFVAFSDEADLRRWVVKQAKDPQALDDLMSRFSLYDQQDGVFWSGVKTSLNQIASGRWYADSKIIDTYKAPIDGDPFEDMRKRTERRLRDDARMSVATSWEAWRTTLQRTVTMLGPLGYAPPLAIPVQATSAMAGLGLGIDREIHGRTFEERRDGLAEGLITFATTVPLGAIFDGLNTIPEIDPSYFVGERFSTQARQPFALAPVQRLNGRIGYPLSPLKPPRLPGGEAEVPRSDELPSNHDEDVLSSGHGEAAAPVVDEGYIAQVVPRNSLTRAYHLNERLRRNIENRRTRMDEFRMDSLRANDRGYQVSTDHSIVYRYDMRSPEELIANGGFGPSGDDDAFGTFHGVPSMLSMPFTRGNGTMQAADRAFTHRLMDQVAPLQPGQAFHDYVIWTEGREVASVSDNANVADGPSYDEVHFPHDIPIRDIYIFGSSDPRYATAVAELFESPHVSTPYGVPLEALVEYLAGRLNINLPNRFSEQRPAQYLDLPSSSESRTNEVQRLP